MKPKKRLDVQVIQKASAVLKVIGHPVRLRIIEALDHAGEASVNELIKVLKTDQVTLSKHLSVLRKKNIVRSRAQENFRYYAIADHRVINILECVRKHARA